MMKAVVKNGRLVLDEPTKLPEGTVLFLSVGDGTDDLDDEERARLHACLERGIAQMRKGRTVPAEAVLEKLRRRR
jgi:hypothetical protein